MTVHSGRYAGVKDGANVISTVRDWVITETVQSQRWVASNTKGGSGRKRGALDWSGTFNTYGVPTLSLMPGQYIDFEGFTAPDTGVEGTAGLSYKGNAIIDSVAITFNPDTGVPVASAYSFSANDVLQKDPAATLDDTSMPSIIDSICVEILRYGSTPTVIDETQNLTLTFTADNQAYVKSSSPNCGQTYRKPGPLDWNISANVLNNAQPIAPGGIDEFMVHLDDTSFILLRYGIVNDYSNIASNRETGALIGYTMNIQMSAFNAANDARGSVVLPPGDHTGELWWGETIPDPGP